MIIIFPAEGIYVEFLWRFWFRLWGMEVSTEDPIFLWRIEHHGLLFGIWLARMMMSGTLWRLHATACGHAIQHV